MHGRWEGREETKGGRYNIARGQRKNGGTKGGREGEEGGKVQRCGRGEVDWARKLTRKGGKERILGEETRKVKCTMLERKVEEEGHRK